MTSFVIPTAEQRDDHLEYFRIDQDVIKTVRNMRKRLMRHYDVCLETVFDHLESMPEVAHYFIIPENLGYLKLGLRAHAEIVFQAKFDEHYYRECDVIGERHSKLEYPSHAYTSGYSNMLAAVIERGMKDKPAMKPAEVIALNRVCLYDMELVMASFHRHQLEKQAALHADAQRVRDMIANTPDSQTG